MTRPTYSVEILPAFAEKTYCQEPARQARQLLYAYAMDMDDLIPTAIPGEPE